VTKGFPDLTSEDVLFVGRGTGVVAWYRTGAPSLHIGCDWVAFDGPPPHGRMVASLKRGGHTLPNFDDYKIIVLQQPAGLPWLHEIRRLQRNGTKVIYEVDDYLHGVHKIKSHKSKYAFSKKAMADFEKCMRVCDAMICSTDWLAKKYRAFNDHVYVCKNFIEGHRYQNFQLPERKTLNIGWAGGEGHLEVVSAWLPAIANVLDGYPQTRFVSMGLDIASLLKRPKQCATLPFVSLENFPAALCNFDIAIAPAGRGGFYAAKSDLRYLETGALGIPLVADPFVYKDIEDGANGLLAEDEESAEQCLRQLIELPDSRRAIGRTAREHVLNHRNINGSIEQWEQVFVSVWDQ